MLNICCVSSLKVHFIDWLNIFFSFIKKKNNWFWYLELNAIYAYKKILYILSPVMIVRSLKVTDITNPIDTTEKVFNISVPEKIRTKMTIPGFLRYK